MMLHVLFALFLSFHCVSISKVEASEVITGFCSGESHNCVIFSNATMKCVGMKLSFGRSKLVSDNIGQEADELGDNLPSINIGTNAVIDQVACGYRHVCVKLGTGSMKCLGMNTNGQLGLGSSTNYIGAVSGHVGDNLPTVSLGSGLQALDIALGQYHSCVKVTGNIVKCFGSNDLGILGLGGSRDRGSSSTDMGDNLPAINLGTDVEVASLHTNPFAQHNCVIISKPTSIAQRVKCWGLNNYHQLGFDDTINRGYYVDDMGDNLTVLDLGTESKVKQLALGGRHTCVLLVSNDLKCFGRGEYGQLASGSGTDSSNTGDSTPSVFIDSGKTIKFIAAGQDHTCIVYNDAISVKCFGINEYGQLGRGDTGNRGNSPTSMIPSIPYIQLGTGALTIASIHSGKSFNCIIFADSAIRCFGDNSNGQFAIVSEENFVGDENNEMGSILKTSTFTGAVATFPPTPMVTKPILSLCTGGCHACSVFDNKKMKCWGCEMGLGLVPLEYGYDRYILGDDPDELGDNLPYFGVGSGVGIEKVSCGNSHVCVKLDSGDMKCFGNNNAGLVGIGSTATSVGVISGHFGDQLPVVNLGSGLKVLDITTGSSFTCVIITGSKVKCLGSNQYGQLGYGDSTNRGALLAQMGDNLPFVELGTDVLVASAHSGQTANHVCVILSAPAASAQRIKCWGSASNYKLGYGVDNNNSGDFDGIGDQASEMGDNLTLVDLGTESRVKQLGIGAYHTCALLVSDSLKCWGSGYIGQLGSGSVASISSTGNLLPSVLIDSGKTIALLTTGELHNCIVYDDMITMKCFGYNNAGQLGQGDNDNRGDSPTTMIPSIPKINFGVGSLNIASVYSGYNFNCAVFVDSSVKCFGDKIYAQLANGRVSGTYGGGDFSTGDKMKFAKLFSSTSSPTTSSTPSPTSTSSPTTSSTPSPTKTSSAQQRFTWINHMMLLFVSLFILYKISID